MSLLYRLRAHRPTSFSPPCILRSPGTRRDPFLAHNTAASLHRLGSRSRFYSSNSYTTSSKKSLLWSIIGLNAGVFFYTVYLKEEARQGHPLGLVNFMKNMTANLDGVTREGRWWTLVTPCFMHVEPLHILGNMLSMYYIGQLLVNTPVFSTTRLLILILGSGIAGTVGHLAFRAQKIREQEAKDGPSPYGRRDHVVALGASGCVMGVGTVAAFLYPTTTFQIYGIIPVPLWVLMAGYAVYDGYYLNSSNSRIGHAGHLGGGAFGVLYYFFSLRGMRVPRF